MRFPVGPESPDWINNAEILSRFFRLQIVIFRFDLLDCFGNHSPRSCLHHMSHSYSAPLMQIIIKFIACIEGRGTAPSRLATFFFYSKCVCVWLVLSLPVSVSLSLPVALSLFFSLSFIGRGLHICYLYLRPGSCLKCN